MNDVPRIADTPESVAKLIEYWKAAELTDQDFPDDLRLLQQMHAEWELGANFAATDLISDERMAFEHRHSFWLQHVPSSCRNDQSHRSYDLADHPGCAIRRYSPQDKSQGDLIYLHGGGWVLGSLDSHDRLCQVLCEGTSMTVYALDSPRAPEVRPDDILDSINLAIRKIDSPEETLRILAGDSAGATLSLLTALKEDRSIKWDGLGWFYGPLVSEMSLRSHEVLADFGRLSRDKMVWYWDGFLGGEDFASRVDPKTFSRLPPCFLACGGQDLLLDDTLHLASNLCDQAIEVTLHVQADMPHGYLQTADHVSAARQSAEVFFGWVERLKQKKKRY